MPGVMGEEEGAGRGGDSDLVWEALHHWGGDLGLCLAAGARLVLEGRWAVARIMGGHMVGMMLCRAKPGLAKESR